MSSTYGVSTAVSHFFTRFVSQICLYIGLSCLVVSQANAQSCSGAADMWFANDESGSVNSSEMTQALDFLYQVSDGFVFDELSGSKAAVFGWSDNLSPVHYILPATDSYSDADDTGLLDPNRDGSDSDNNIVVDGDGTGIREVYPARTYSNGTWLAAATNELASVIGSAVDTNSDGVTDNGRRGGVPQIAVLLTDASSGQMVNAGSGGGAGNEGGSDWNTAMATLEAAGPDGTNIVLMLIDDAAVAYGDPGAGNEGTAGSASVRALIDGFVTNYGVTLYVGGTYAEIADPVNNFVSGLVNAVCDLADIALYVQNYPRVYTTLSPFSLTFEFSDDVSGFTLADIIVGNGTPSNLVQLTPSTYTVEITPDGSNSDITIDVAVNAAQSIPDSKPSRPALQTVIEYDGDGDGIGDTSEGTATDSDGDLVFDNVDIDSDNDGIPDVIENGTEGAVDTDADGIPDYLDLDSDNDGIPDNIESGSALAISLDADGDGQIDAGAGFGVDGLADSLQIAGDGGALNYVLADTDGDGIYDFRDLDSDNDSLADLIESGLSDTQIAALDTDSDGAIDSPTETPANVVGSEGIVDALQGNIDGDPITYSMADTDNDGLRDAIDLDVDNDGVPDLIEAGNTSAIAQDANNDGQLQAGESAVGSDGIPNDAQGGVDGGALANATNSDSASESGSPVPDYRDLDSDNDGLFDVVETGGSDSDGNAFADGEDANGDGMIDSGFIASPVDTVPTDTPDYQNPDSNAGIFGDDNDGDATASPLDASPNDGVIDDTSDTDGDGILDVLDDLNSAGVLAHAALIVAETAGTTQVNEDGAGNTDTFTVVLQRPPLTDVVINLSSTDTGEVTVPAAITFTSGNWDIPQVVTVSGVADDFVDGPINTTINIVVDDALSSDEYDGLNDSVLATVVDTTVDTDGDGIANIFEGTGDTDGDGIPDASDDDSDNDGIPDAVEVGNDVEDIADTDGDGTPDYREIDSDNDGIIDALEVGPSVLVPIDTDNDSIPDYIDTDSDNDSIPDSVEDIRSPVLSGVDIIGLSPGAGNGIDDAVDVLVTGGADLNSNGVDDDLEPSNLDGDSLPDHRDLDSDGDGILDRIEADNVPSPLNSDADGDGIDDAIDVDSTGGEDANGNGLDDALEPRDSDADGQPDFLDVDSDNDGIPDAVEAAANGSTLPALSGSDTDSDGIDDNVDADNGGSATDVNLNGISDNAEPVDTDGDGLPDYRDLDSDNDSLLDIDEAGGTDLNLDGQVDDPVDQGTLTAPTNSDTDAIPDYRDLESDNGANDGSAGFDIDSNPLPAPGGAAGFDTAPQDGQVDDATDGDGDGIADDVDLDPNTYGGALDSDNDMIPDVIDLDDDNDGIPDVAEGIDELNLANSTDTDGDGIADYLDLDSDNDGLFDVIEASTSATDTDGNGLVDDFVDTQPTPLSDGLHDEISPAFIPVDSDGDSVPDFRDTDSDDDSISDLAESVEDLAALNALDSNDDGEVDNVDPNTGLPLDSVSQPISIEPLDSDNDGRYNFRDLDSDNDGFSDAVEAAGSSGNSFSDSREAGDGELRTSVKGGGGSMNGLFLVGLMFMVLRKHSMQLRAIFSNAKSSAAVLGVVMSVGVVSVQDVRAESNSQPVFDDYWYGGAGIGLSHVDPEGESNDWITNDDSSNSWEIFIGKHFKPHWFAELKYVDMGEAGLGNKVPAKDQAFPDANISYTVPSLMLGYLVRDVSERLNFYGKAGIALIENKVHDDGSTVGFKEVTDTQFAIGAGLEYRSSESRWFTRLNVDSYDRDAWYVGLSVHRKIGRSEK